MTAVHAYTTGCRNSPGYWGRERTVFKSWKEHRADRVSRDYGLGRAAWTPGSGLPPAGRQGRLLSRAEICDG